MGAPTTASATVEIDAPADEVFDLIADVTRMGDWSPECTGCEWVDEPGVVGSTFRGHNRSGPIRWTTTARVQASDRPRRFAFATLNKDQDATRWSFELEGDGPTTVTERFEAVSAPFLIGLAERLFLRNRQAQLETGMAETLAKIKAAAEAH